MSNLEKDYEELCKELATKIADITSQVQELNTKIMEVQRFALDNNLDFPGVTGVGSVRSFKALPQEVWDNSGCSSFDDEYDIYSWAPSGTGC